MDLLQRDLWCLSWCANLLPSFKHSGENSTQPPASHIYFGETGRLAWSTKSSQHICSAPIVTKWVWGLNSSALSTKQQEGRATHTQHTRVNVCVRVESVTLGVCCREQHSFPVLMSPRMLLNLQILGYSSNSVQSKRTRLAFTCKSGMARRVCLIKYNRHTANM